MILEELSSADNLETFFFNLDQTASESGNEMDARINKYKIDKLDVVILSLGEDGHLAGNFYNSRSINDRITYTNSSPKPPEKRISFSVEWLVQSNVVIIVALGIEKCSAINDLYQKKNGFSDLISKSENIFLLTDQSVSSDINWSLDRKHFFWLR